MPRPEEQLITFTLDGLEVTAPQGAMLVDAAKRGDVEIPVFCYEPKLGQPVGACRMCLVEVEGIPKLQTACSTPVKDGMVVNTQTDRVRDAQKAVVEFLLINHPLDCPVCDKGGECPLQDVTMGWGAGTSRFVEPKRHFKKPLELSPLIAIDRERCILCYRCVRFSQEVSEDYQLVLQERGANSFVATFDGHPYVAPFSGNVIELCPVGALTGTTYRFRARPWDIEGAGSVCTLCPAQCNVEFTVRDDKVMRVLARDHDGVDDGWLCDKGRFAYQHVHADARLTQPLVREGTRLMPATWEKAFAAAASALAKAGPKAAAIAGGETTNEEAFLVQRLFREQLGSGNLAARPGGDLPPELDAALADPALQASVPDLEFAHAVLVVDAEPIEDAPVLDLRLRKGVRRRGLKLAVASARPSALDPNAVAVLRHAPGAGEALLVALDAALGGDAGALSGAATAAGTNATAVRQLAEALTSAGEEVVLLVSERVLGGPRGIQAARALLNVADRLQLRSRDGGGILVLPSSTNGRGLAEVGFAPHHGPGHLPTGVDGADAPGIAAGLADGSLSTLLLLHADPLRSFPDRAAWERALGAAQQVVVVDSVLSDTAREHATVVLPAEAYAEKEGTLTHPDGRVQRLRPAIGHPDEVRALWQVLAQVAKRAGLDVRAIASSMVSKELFAAVPFYAELTLDALGGRGLRWPADAEAAAAFPAPNRGAAPMALDQPPSPAQANGVLRLGTFRSLWASKEVDASPALQFIRPGQVVELSPVDAERLGVSHGQAVEVGGRVVGKAVLRSAIPTGSVFLREGTHEQPANVLTDALVSVTPVGALNGHAPEDAESAVTAPAAGPANPTDLAAGGLGE